MGKVDNVMLEHAFNKSFIWRGLVDSEDELPKDARSFDVYTIRGTLKNYIYLGGEWIEAKEIIEEKVLVVRCKDCKHRLIYRNTIDTNNIKEHCLCNLMYRDSLVLYTGPIDDDNFYCAWGERRARKNE